MNRGGLPEMMMLHCLKTSGGVSISKGAELNVLERQRSSGKWQQQPQQQGSAYSNVYTASAQGGDDQFRGQLCRDAGLQQVMVKPESGLDIAWTGFGNYGMPIVEDLGGFLDDSSYRMTKSCSLVSAVGESNEGKGSILTERANLGGAMESCKKRKAEMASTKEMKKMKEWAEDGESKVTSTNNKGKNKAGDASKVYEVKKTEYIHVRARRGQATDSHSLAERVRREKISERMKYLQELVPGCNRITGKAGMLDEIINYVQSLQGQVEFLSMKLATINFSIESLFGKEVFTPSTSSSYPTLGDPAYLQFNPLEVVSSGMDIGNYKPKMGLQLQQQLPETYVDTTSFNQNPSTWEAELQNLLAMEFQGGSMSFPSQPFTVSIEASNQKMEI